MSVKTRIKKLRRNTLRYLQMLPVFLLINGVSLQDTVVGFIGGSAVLLCSSKEPQLTIQDVEVQWRHNNWNVYAIIKDKVAMEEQDAEYRNRTESFPAEYVRGNFSLKLNNLQYSDEGEYKCYISEDSIIQNIITVELLIKDVSIDELGVYYCTNIDRTAQFSNGTRLDQTTSITVPTPVSECLCKNHTVVEQSTDPTLWKTASVVFSLINVCLVFGFIGINFSDRSKKKTHNSDDKDLPQLS
ncbi:CD276 antigen-like protein [Labeo rohita]|uniref:CD276 antigen-like protein n=1 Tax=Labeo rohita TaxID=84645 RepID=A0A498MF78_LABRO|nr:CD276 antigen-like protein [Labeo rohita]